MKFLVLLHVYKVTNNVHHNYMYILNVSLLLVHYMYVFMHVKCKHCVFMWMSFSHLFSLFLMQVRIYTHMHHQQLMDTIHSKSQPCQFDFFKEFEKKMKQKRKQAMRCRNQMCPHLQMKQTLIPGIRSVCK